MHFRFASPTVGIWKRSRLSSCKSSHPIGKVLSIVARRFIYALLLAFSTFQANAQTQPTWPVLFVHGILGHGSGWNVMAERLSGSGSALKGVRLRTTTQSSPMGCDYTNDWQNSSPTDWAPLPSANVAATARYFAIDFSDNVGLPFAFQAEELKKVIDCVRSITGAQTQTKVILVTHSMGGIASRYYLQGRSSGGAFANDVATLVTIGTPHAGSIFTRAEVSKIQSWLDFNLTYTTSGIRNFWSSFSKSPMFRELSSDSYSVRLMNEGTRQQSVQSPVNFTAYKPLPTNVTYVSLRVTEAGFNQSIQGYLAAYRGDMDGIVPVSSQSLFGSLPAEGRVNISHQQFDFTINSIPSDSSYANLTSSCSQDFVAHVGCETKDNLIVGKVREIVGGTTQFDADATLKEAWSLESGGLYVTGAYYLSDVSSFQTGFSWTINGGPRKEQAQSIFGQTSGDIAQVIAAPPGSVVSYRAFIKIGATTINSPNRNVVVPNAPNSGLGTPTSLSPSNAASLSLPVSLSWGAVANATSYKVYVAPSATDLPTNPAAPSCSRCNFIGDVVGTTRVLPNSILEPGKTYFWSVQALGGGQYGPLSTPRQFSVPSSSTLPPPVLSTPTNGAVIAATPWLTLSWQPVSGAASYRVLVASSATALALQPTDVECIGDCTQMAIIEGDTSFTFNTAALSPGQTYYWTVKARGLQAGNVASPRSFMMAQAACSYFFTSNSALSIAAVGGTQIVGIQSQPGCSGTIASNQGFCALSSTTFTANSSGQASVSVTLPANGSTSRSCTLSMTGASPLTVQQAANAPSTSYTLTIPASSGGSGGIWINNAFQGTSATLPAGTTVEIRATPNGGFVFSGWQDGGSIISTGASNSFSLASTRTITPIFSSTQVSITPSISPSVSTDQRWRVVGSGLSGNQTFQKQGESISLQSGTAYQGYCTDTPYHQATVGVVNFTAPSSFTCSYTARAQTPFSPALTTRAQPRMASSQLTNLARLDDGRVVFWGDGRLNDFPDYSGATQTTFSGTPTVKRPLFVSGASNIAGVHTGAGRESMFLKSNSGNWLSWGDVFASNASSRIPTTDNLLAGFVKLAGNLGLKSDGSVWAVNQSGLHTPVATLSNIVDIAGTFSTTFSVRLALRSDGAVVSFTDPGGSIPCVIHGVGTSTTYWYQNCTAPFALPGINRVVSIAATQDNGFAVRDDGTVWVWGLGSLNGGATRNAGENQPLQIPGISGAVEVVAGRRGVVYVRTTGGEVYAWGTNDLGQLGRATVTSTEATPQIVQGLTNVIELGKTDGYNLLALDSSGFVWNVGVATTLGNGSTVTTQSTAVKVSCPSGYTGDLNITNFAANCQPAANTTLTLTDPSPSFAKEVRVNGVLVSLPHTQQFPFGSEVTINAQPSVGIGFSGFDGDLYDPRSRIRSIIMNRDWTISPSFRQCQNDPWISTDRNAYPPLNVSAAGGEYPINVYSDGSPMFPNCHWGFYSPDTWVTSYNGDGFGPATFSVRVEANPGLTARSTTLFVGGGGPGSNRSIQVNQAAAASDSTPDPFSFGSLIGAPLSTLVQSGAIQVSGINAPAAISIANGEYSIGCNGSFTSAASSIANGNAVCVRHTSASAVGGSVTTTLTVGGVSGIFTSSTVAAVAPGSPTAVSAVGGNAQATISFAAPVSTGGATISAYQVTSNNGITASGAASPITVTGLANGNSYTFTVTATNSAGTSVPSAPSNAVTPQGQSATTTTLGVAPGSAVSYGSTVTMTGTVGGGSTPSGTIVFRDGGTPIGSGTLSGLAGSFSTNILSVGSHSLTASYGGDANNAPSTSGAVVVTVGKATPNVGLVAAPSPAVFGKVVTFTATVSGGISPTGSVTFRDGAATLGSGALNAGTAIFATTGLATGSRSITAFYAGDGNHNAVTSSPLVLTVNVSTAGASVRADLNGDGKSDVLWRNTTTGENYLYIMNGLTVASGGYLPTVPTAWSVAGMGNFDGDTKADILWRNGTTGENYLYFMNGTTVTSGGYLPTVPLAWIVAGTGDFNGDGKTDILWRNTTTGENYVYFMNGLTVTSGGYLPSVPTTWTVAGVNDLDGDNKADILWRNTSTGENYVYLMNGLTVTTGGYLPTVPLAWTVAGMGDFNSDTKADILWRNTTTGENYAYFMNGLTVTSGGYLPSVPTAWTVVGTGDHDGDGKADILWRNTTTGDDYLYIMNGLTVSSGGYLPNVPTNWVVTKQ